MLKVYRINVFFYSIDTLPPKKEYVWYTRFNINSYGWTLINFKIVNNTKLCFKAKIQILNPKIYHAFIEANLNYCLLIWMNRNKTYMKNIENVQKQALRMVFNDCSSSYQELLK